MNCDRIQQTISDCLDDGTPLPAELRRHADACPSCAAFERDLARMDSLLAAGRADAPPAPERRQMPVGVKVALGALAAAAAVLAVVLVRQAMVPPAVAPAPGASLASMDADFTRFPKRTVQAAEAAALNPYRRELASLAANARSVSASLLAYLPAPQPDRRAKPGDVQPRTTPTRIQQR